MYTINQYNTYQLIPDIIEYETIEEHNIHAVSALNILLDRFIGIVFLFYNSFSLSENPPSGPIINPTF